MKTEVDAIHDYAEEAGLTNILEVVVVPEPPNFTIVDRIMFEHLVCAGRDAIWTYPDFIEEIVYSLEYIGIMNAPIEEVVDRASYIANNIYDISSMFTDEYIEFYAVRGWMDGKIIVLGLGSYY